MASAGKNRGVDRPSAIAAQHDPLLASVPVPIYAVDGDWSLTFVNAEASRLLRRAAEELVGRSIWETWPRLRGTISERQLTRAMRERVRVAYVSFSPVVDHWLLVRAAPHGDGLLIAIDDVSELKRAEQDAGRLAAEKAAFARIADAVARRVSPRPLFSAVAREVAGLHDIENSAIFRFTGPREFEVVGTATRLPVPLVAAGAVSDDDQGIFDELRRTEAPVRGRIDEVDSTYSEEMQSVGRKAWLHLPIRAEGRLWGAFALTSARIDAFDDETVTRMSDFAELVTLAIGNADAQDKLARMAATDPVTGLANHRVFHARLSEETAAAARYGRPLSIALFDLDRFGDVNDLHGHLAGDAILAEVGERLSAIAQPWQLLARIGGDEFGLIMPGLRPDGARTVIERARAAVAARPFGVQRSELTISAGIADLATAGHGELLFACADGALYWAKLNGRDLVCTFEPSIVSELSPTDRAETLLRQQTLAGITSLAHAIDAKDPSTREHSDRVARLVELLARERGWDEARVRLLREAALVHDVGKIGVPDVILLQTGSLTAEQWEVVRRHAALGAEIVSGILNEEQTGWVRSHHERPDGGGYPDGLRDGEISEGTALLTIADALDVMTIGRPYSRPLPLPVAVTECERLAGTQFTPEAAAALRALYEAGALADWDHHPSGG